MGIRLSQQNLINKVGGRKKLSIELFPAPHSAPEKTAIQKMISEAVRKGEEINIAKYEN